MAKSLGRLSPDKCVFLICDVQERFRTAIHGFNNVVVGSQRMLRASKELNIPTIVTEQYPKGLLKTVEELEVTGANGHAEVFEKTCFTMLCPSASERLAAIDFTDAIIVGLEAHVCVQQTTLDLIAMGRNVHLCVDAVSSSTPVDRACGLHRCERAGAFLTTTESVLMELIRGKDHPSFKAISTNLKETKVAEPLGFI